MKRLYAQKNRVYSDPEAVVQAYLRDVWAKMGIEPGDPWQLWQLSGTIPFARMTGMKRIHHHLSHILALPLKGKARASQAYSCMLIRPIHQMVVDNGNWDTANCFLPREDVCGKTAFASTEADLEGVVAYQEALKKLGGARRQGGVGE